MVGFAIKQQKASTAGSCDFSPQGTVPSRERVKLINVRIRDFTGNPALGLPSLVQQLPELVQITPLEGGAHLRTEHLHLVQGFYGRTCVSQGGSFLLPQDRPGVVGRPCEEQHQIRFEFTQKSRILFNRFHQRGAIRIERDVIQAAKGGRVFILFTNLFPQDMARDVEGLLREFVLGDRALDIGGQCLQYVYANAGRRSQARARRYLGGQKQIDRNVAIYFLENSQWNLQSAALELVPGDVLPGLADSQIRGNDLDASVRPLS